LNTASIRCVRSWWKLLCINHASGKDLCHSNVITEVTHYPFEDQLPDAFTREPITCTVLTPDLNHLIDKLEHMSIPIATVAAHHLNQDLFRGMAPPSDVATVVRESGRLLVDTSDQVGLGKEVRNLGQAENVDFIKTIHNKKYAANSATKVQPLPDPIVPVWISGREIDPDSSRLVQED